jgi:ribosomal protein L44E
VERRESCPVCNRYLQDLGHSERKPNASTELEEESERQKSRDIPDIGGSERMALLHFDILQQRSTVEPPKSILIVERCERKVRASIYSGIDFSYGLE